MTRVPKVVLVGEMGAGKSTVGRLVADLLGWPYRDNDQALEARAGRTAAEIAAEDGSDALHDLERVVLEGLLDAAEPSVVAAPGAVATFTTPARLRERAFVVWLQASPEVLADRASTSSHRPLPPGDPAQHFGRLAAERDAFFAAAADLTIDADRTVPDEAADQIVRALLGGEWLGVDW